jgi:hypothetical protein
MIKLIKKYIYRFANTNWFQKYTWIRVAQCVLVGHHPKIWGANLKKGTGWCGWCERKTSLSPKFRKEI